MRRILFRITSALGVIAATALLISTILSACNTIGRVAFTVSLAWIEELSCYSAGFIMFIMLQYLEYHDKHLSIAFLDERFRAAGNARGRQTLFYIRGAASVFIFLQLAAAGRNTFMRNYAIDARSPTLEFPYGALYLTLFMCVALTLAIWVFRFFLKQRGGENEPV